MTLTGWLNLLELAAFKTSEIFNFNFHDFELCLAGKVKRVIIGKY